MKPFMEQLISPHQSAFVGGRQIQDNLIIVQEAFHKLKSPGLCSKNCAAIKLDLNKAFDKIEWEFLRKALLAFGFAEAWVSLVMKLVQGVSYRFKLNGAIGEKLIPQRGLHQGDPLSPYLFIICIDVLSHMISNHRSSGSLQGMTLAPSSPPLTHLFFADDAILFTKATNQEFYQLQQILNSFSEALGQRINIVKSGFIGGKYLPAQRKSELANILSLQIWDNPGLYLGIPAEWGRSKTQSLAWIKEKLLNKIQGWKSLLLNQAGKEVLIKSVLQAVPTYAMSLLKFPKGFYADLCAKIANFWWRTNHDRGVHWRKWEIMTLSKKDGGMGFKDFEHLNQALLAKQAWRLLEQPHSLWARIIKSIYFPNCSFLEAKKGRSPS